MLAVDNYPWACENTGENIGLNNCRSIEVIQAEAQQLGQRSFDVVLANINLNVLLEIIPTLNSLLHPGGLLLLSGFYEHDLKKIDEPCKGLLNMIENTSLGDWMVAVYRKAR